MKIKPRKKYKKGRPKVVLLDKNISHKRSPPEYVPTAKDRTLVTRLSGIGRLPEADIAFILGIRVPALQKYFRYELDTAHPQAMQKVADNMYRIATLEWTKDLGPVVRAALYFLQTGGMNWRNLDDPDDPTTAGRGGQIHNHVHVYIPENGREARNIIPKHTGPILPVQEDEVDHGALLEHDPE